MSKKKYDTESIELNFKDESEKKEAELLDSKEEFNISEDDLLLKNSKVSISLRLDSDVLKSLKEEAEKRGIKYQTFLNAFLRKHFVDTENTPNLVRIVQDLQNRVEEIEHKIESA